jgi:hypothetical protein
MADPSCSARLATEARERSRVCEHVRSHDLDRDGPIETVVVPSVDDAHSTLSEDASDAVGTDTVWRHVASRVQRTDALAHVEADELGEERVALVFHLLLDPNFGGVIRVHHS